MTDRTASPTASPVPLTVAGAADLVARELRAHECQGAFAGVPPAAFASIRRAQRVLDACVAELRDPITHRPCCAAADRAQRPGRTG